jgi:hypothetical protein
MPVSFRVRRAVADPGRRRRLLRNFMVHLLAVGRVRLRHRHGEADAMQPPDVRLERAAQRRGTTSLPRRRGFLARYPLPRGIAALYPGETLIGEKHLVYVMHCRDAKKLLKCPGGIRKGGRRIVSIHPDSGVIGHFVVATAWGSIMEGSLPIMSTGVRAMKRLQLAVLFSIACAVQFFTLPARGQDYRSRYYRPPRPAISPWFDLGRLDPGPLGPYHSYIRPKQELYRNLQQQGAALQQQHAALSSMGKTISNWQRVGSVRPTGTGGVFMNYSHYYQLRASSGRARRNWQPPAPSRGSAEAAY